MPKSARRTGLFSEPQLRDPFSGIGRGFHLAPKRTFAADAASANVLRRSTIAWVTPASPRTAYNTDIPFTYCRAVGMGC